MRIRWLIVGLMPAAVVGLAGCSLRHMAEAPRAPLGLEAATPAQIFAVAQTRARRPSSIQMDSRMVARGRGSPLRLILDTNLLWKDPDRTRLRVKRNEINLMELIERDGELSLLFWKTREGYRGPVEDLQPELAILPFSDAAALTDVPLIDASLADAATDLEAIRPPRFSAWRRHLWLTSADSGNGAIWALNPQTLTVEAVAHSIVTEVLRGREMWLLLEVQRYEVFDVSADARGELAVLPSAFRLSLVRHPWRRRFRGELWSLEFEVRRHLLGRDLSEAMFDVDALIRSGWQIRPLRDLRALPASALSEG